jgi:hypothetical protein
VALAALSLVPLAAGFLFALAVGGRPRRLAHLRLHRVVLLAPALLVVGLIMRGVPPGPAPLRLALLVAAGLVAAAWLVVTWATRPAPVTLGLAVVLSGCLLNGLAMAANGYMPVAAPVGVDEVRYAPLDAATRLGLLGDVIPVPALHAVVSVGDLALAAGVALTVLAAMTTPEPPARPAA